MGLENYGLFKKLKFNLFWHKVDTFKIGYRFKLMFDFGRYDKCITLFEQFIFAVYFKNARSFVNKYD